MRRLLLLAATLAAAGCGPGSGPRTLWLDSPRDGTLTLEDHEPPPY